MDPLNDSSPYTFPPDSTGGISPIQDDDFQVPQSTSPPMASTPSPAQGVRSMVDNLATNLGLSDDQADALYDLQSLGLGGGLPAALIDMQLYSLGQTFRCFNQLNAQINSDKTSGTVKKLLKKFEQDEENKLQVSEPQRKNIRAVIDEDALEAIKKKADTLGFKGIFNVPSKLATLRTFVQSQSSNIRGQFRLAIKQSLEKQKTLEKTVMRLKNTYLRNGGVTYNEKMMGERVSMLRRFMVERPEFLSSVGKDAEDEDGEQDSPELSDDEEYAVNQDGSRKRSRRTGVRRSGGGRPAKGADFWGQFDKWLEEKSDEKTGWGKDMNQGNWRQYIDETVALDRNKWKKSSPSPSVGSSIPHTPQRLIQPNQPGQTLPSSVGVTTPVGLAVPQASQQHLLPASHPIRSQVGFVQQSPGSNSEMTTVITPSRVRCTFLSGVSGVGSVQGNS
ncbi:hypothetical protein PQX77_010815 [Marasmius sp. AFHP31]|nr:hypothetical protein PQX77_010815 [Marasmius sp. AFHP31]